ncbi:autophagy-related protein 23 [Monosporozyma unispora]|nr:Autophagy protein [Kazachstania unispora]
MELEEILQQQVEIDQLFDHLVKVHKIALLGDDNNNSSNQKIKDNLSLNNIRHDITVCLNDFNVLNNMLISYDGKIKGDIDFLRKAKISISKMKQRQNELQRKQNEWNYTTEVIEKEHLASQPSNGNSIEIKTSYRYKMNKYIEMVGIDNTSLSQEPTNDVDNSKVINDDVELTGTQTKKALHLLDESYNEIQNEIKALDTLMNNLKKDASFIEKERRQKLGYIKLQQRQFDHELNSLETNINDLLNKCGLVLPSNVGVPISQKLFHLSLYWNEQRKRKLKEENGDIINHSDEFIDLKIKELKDQLTHRKSNSSKLLADKKLWEDCVTNLEELEDYLNQVLAMDQTILPSKLIQKISIKIDYLESLLRYTENVKIKELIDDEIYSLKMACKELSPKRTQISQTSENKDDNSNRDKTYKIHSTFHINPITNTSAPFVVGKSPPKIGISHDYTKSTSHTTNKKNE